MIKKLYNGFNRFFDDWGTTSMMVVLAIWLIGSFGVAVGLWPKSVANYLWWPLAAYFLVMFTFMMPPLIKMEHDRRRNRREREKEDDTSHRPQNHRD